MTTTAEWRKWNALRTKPITNYDCISKTPEELAKWIGEHIDCECCPVAHDEPISGTDECHKRILDWLKQEATDAK